MQMKKLDFRFTVAAICFILFTSAFAQNKPPQEPNKREADLLELIKLDKTVKLDIRYARTDNFVGKAVYKEARAFLQRPAAEALVRANKALKKEGFGIVVFDGYRPWSITKLFWEVTPDDKRKYVANPKTGSKHNRGCAVDLSLYDLKTGKLAPMPSDFDEFTERASPDYRGASEEETRNRELLRKTMEAEGFTVNPNEWWHFDYKDWPSYAIYDISFDDAGSLDKKPKKPKIKEKKELKQFFDAAGLTGGFYLYDLNKNEYTVYDRERLDRPFIPASTSKILHSLIFLDSGVIRDENETLAWDGVRRSVEAWNQDQNLRSAVKVSAVWFFVEVSKRLGRERMQKYYDAVGYGNRRTDGFGEDYWNKGELRVTPREQIEFLVKFHRNRLPFSPQVIAIVKDILIDDKTDRYILRAKTGWSSAFTPQVGWWVGYVERGANTYFFATELDLKKDEDAPQRKEITRSILKYLKII
ncbi:MAG: class D beta-lactamase [Acidobacteria bacterium]|nr:class D beta-lactamase [Acidobacteriota bacterium]